MIKHPASYRDFDAYVCTHNGVIYRVLSEQYRAHFEYFEHSKLYQKLIQKSWLVSHERAFLEGVDALCIKPWKIPFENYPYEWGFEQLKAAALRTLDIQILALEHGMMLKDASPYNIMFVDGNPLFIDTSSFIIRSKNEAWPAYKQFIESFLLPLSMASYAGRSIRGLFLEYPNGISLALGAKQLPWRSYFSVGMLAHVHGASKGVLKKSSKAHTLSTDSMQTLMRHLKDTVLSLTAPNNGFWVNYYHEVHQKAYFEQKWIFLKRHLELVKPVGVLDVGTNTAAYAQKINQLGIPVKAIESNQSCVDAAYKMGKGFDVFVMDVLNLSASGGVLNEERLSFMARNKADFTVFFALMHHLFFQGGLSLARIVSLMHGLSARYILVEWVDVKDEKCVEISVESRIEHYKLEIFMEEVLKYFNIIAEEPIVNKQRTLFFLEKRNT